MQPPKALCLKSVLHNKRRHHNEKPRYSNQQQSPLGATREGPSKSKEDLVQPKINNVKKKDKVIIL